MTATSRIALDPPATVIALRPRADFVATPAVGSLTDRALSYLQAGFPVHFRGPAGTGKTTLALHVAAQLGRPMMLITGDEEFATSDLVGGQNGYSYRKVVDRYIHSVLKYEEDSVQRWVDNRLTTACREGFTLVYDEFTRSRAEANNVLLTVLEERLLVLPNSSNSEAYVRVHPEFRVIFTSNPQEYAGVHAMQDALSDRMITIDVELYDRETEVGITTARSGLPREEAARVVDLVRDYRALGKYDQAPTLRACVMIARVAALQQLLPSDCTDHFAVICLDVLLSKSGRNMPPRERDEQRAHQRELLLGLIDRHCAG